MPLRLALAAACLLALLIPASAPAFTLGVGDRADGNPAVSRSLGASVYRVVIDADIPLAEYDARIYRFRAAGMEPQLVIGGTGTRHHANRFGLPEKALEAYRRWPFAYSISVVNEPDLSGMSVCGYARTYQRAYRLLKRAGMRRVLFGEFSPAWPMTWTRGILRRCGLHLRIEHFAWHGYDHTPEGRMVNTPAIHAMLKHYRDKIGGHTPRLYVTEYGVLPRVDGEVMGMRRWRLALRMARRYLTELVAWDVHSPRKGSAWDSSLIEPNGRPRPAFQIIGAASRVPA